MRDSYHHTRAVLMIESLLLRFAEDMSHYAHIWKCRSSSNTVDSQHEAREQLCHKMIMHCAMKTSSAPGVNSESDHAMPGHSLHAGRRPGRIAKHSQLVLFCPVVMEIGRRSRCLQIGSRTAVFQVIGTPKTHVRHSPNTCVPLCYCVFFYHPPKGRLVCFSG